LEKKSRMDDSEAMFGEGIMVVYCYVFGRIELKGKKKRERGGRSPKKPQAKGRVNENLLLSGISKEKNVVRDKLKME